MGRTALDVLYGAFQRAENKVGGGEGLVGIYGSMTQQGTCSIMAAMEEHAGLGPGSILVDIGSGLCRPLLHACLDCQVDLTFGVELDAVKCQKAVPFVQHVVAMLEAEGVQLPQAALPKVICASVEQLDLLHPATHAYAAWEGFPESAKRAVGRVFAATPSLQAITIVQRSLRAQDPAEVMAELGFGPVECKAAALPVYMAGSGRKLNAYLFVKQGAPTANGAGAPALPAAPAGLCLQSAPAFQPEQVISELNRAAEASAAGATQAGGGNAAGPAPAVAAGEGTAAGAAQHHHHGTRSRGQRCTPPAATTIAAAAAAAVPSPAATATSPAATAAAAPAGAVVKRASRRAAQPSTAAATAAPDEEQQPSEACQQGDRAGRAGRRAAAITAPPTAAAGAAAAAGALKSGLAAAPQAPSPDRVSTSSEQTLVRPVAAAAVVGRRAGLRGRGTM